MSIADCGLLYRARGAGIDFDKLGDGELTEKISECIQDKSHMSRWKGVTRNRFDGIHGCSKRATQHEIDELAVTLRPWAV